jgi:geranylgeranyl pyrophosphate synthase
MKGDALHYGQVQAMNSAHAGIHKTAGELLALPVEPEYIISASKHFHENITMTLEGQMDDIYIEATNKEVPERDVESVLARKTPHYTILGPIELGANLAGVGRIESGLRDYSLAAGCAFQIADDIISTFGAESETGKGSNDDIREGKMTLLVHRALLNGTAAQTAALRATLGNAEATSEQCDTARELLRATGGLEYAESRLATYKEKALAALKTTTKTDPDFIPYLSTLVRYVADRRS